MFLAALSNLVLDLCLRYLTFRSDLDWLIILFVCMFTWFDLIVYWKFSFKYWVTSMHLEPLVKFGDPLEQEDFNKKTNALMIIYDVAASMLVISWATMEIVEEINGTVDHDQRQYFDWINNMYAFAIFSVLYGVLKIATIVFFAMALYNFRSGLKEANIKGESTKIMGKFYVNFGLLVLYVFAFAACMGVMLDIYYNKSDRVGLFCTLITIAALCAVINYLGLLYVAFKLNICYEKENLKELMNKLEEEAENERVY